LPTLPDISQLGNRPVPQADQTVQTYNPAVLTSGQEAVGKSLESAGQALDQTGQNLNDLNVKFQTIDAGNKINAAQQQMHDFFYDPQNGALNRQGMNAQGVTSQFKQFSDNLTSSTLADIQNPVVRATAQHELAGMVNDNLDTAMRHESDQVRSATSNYYDQQIANGQTMMQQYNDPAALQRATTQITNATIAKQKLLGTYQPGTDAAIATGVTGQVATTGINNALAQGDLDTANTLRQQHSDAIPGFQQLPLDSTLHTANMRQTVSNGMAATQSGQPIPQTVGAPPSQVQATVADTAHANGLDPNLALTTARIESNFGQNVGSRGDIGQTGKPAADVHGQAQNMVESLKTASINANEAVGGQAQDWQKYLCYQQGTGGGPALLKADPNAKAVAVLTPLYKTLQQAASAIVNNGGNASMTVSDFCNFIQQKYTQNAQRASVDLPANGSSPGASILAAHTTPGQAVQPAVSPRQQLLNFDMTYPAQLAQINANPNPEVRQNLVQGLNGTREQFQMQSSAYIAKLMNQAQQTYNDPGFTNINQMPADLMSDLIADHPNTLHVMELRAKQNAQSASGGMNKEAMTYGSGFFNVFQGVHAGSFTSADDLTAHLPGGKLYQGGQGPQDLTLDGYDKLKGEFPRDAPDKSEGAMRAAAFGVVKQNMSMEDPSLGIKDPHGEENYANALPLLYQAIDAGQKAGKTPAQLYSPNSPDFIGHATDSLKRSDVQQHIDALNSGASASPSAATPTLVDLQHQYQSETDPAKKDAIILQAKKMGLLPKPDNRPSVPIAE
jgi:hypothetical protein